MVRRRRVRVNHQFLFFRVGGYRLYKIETKIKNEQDDIVVYRRYNDFCWLIEAVLKDYPACIVPPIPPKNPFVAWYNDETESL